MPRWILRSALILSALALIPLALIAKARMSKSDQPRIHLIQDMDAQASYRPQSANKLFADGRSMRPKVAGTQAFGKSREDGHYYRGVEGQRWATKFPFKVDKQLLRRGQERFNIYCSTCHGLDGYGQGPVAKRAEQLQEGTWIPPTSMHTDLVRQREVGHLFNSITNGIRSMPAYGSQIEVHDRWAIVAYIRALQRSQNATLEDVPPQERGRLR